jgi:hypothetical protein
VSPVVSTMPLPNVFGACALLDVFNECPQCFSLVSHMPLLSAPNPFPPLRVFGAPPINVPSASPGASPLCPRYVSSVPGFIFTGFLHGLSSVPVVSAL